MTGRDNEPHKIETEADSVFEAAYVALRNGCRMWWFTPDGIIELRGDDVWKVRARRVWDWYSHQTGDVIQRLSAHGLK